MLDRKSKCKLLSWLYEACREIGILLTVGVSGGMVSGLVGSGIDMIFFSVLVLLFRISESVATPTSVILMAVNSVFGVLLQAISLLAQLLKC